MILASSAMEASGGSPFIGLIGILIALVVFLVLIYKGWSSYWVAPICAIIVAVFNLMAPSTVINSYLGGMVDLVQSLFFIIFFGAVLGKLYDVSGAAASIAQTLTNKLVIKAKGDAQIRLGILVILVVSALLTMGGIDGYVLTFTMIPICLVMSEMLDIPRKFIGGMMVLNCAFMAAPGAPQIDNIMAQAAIMSEAYNEEGAFIEVAAANHFGVTSFAAPIPGLVAVIIIAAGGYFTLTQMIIHAKKKGEHFEWGPVRKAETKEGQLPNFIVSLMPILVVFVAYTLFPVITGIQVEIAIALGLGIIVALILFVKFLPAPRSGMPGGINNKIIAVLNEGFGSAPNAFVTLITPSALAGVVTATSAFGMVIGVLSGIHVHYIWLVVIVVCVLVAITSSPPAALMIALPVAMNIMLGQGMSPEQVLGNADGLMRVGALAATTFETLPFNGLIILTLQLIGCTHKEAYKPMLIQSVIYTLVGTIVAAALVMIGL